MANPDHGQNGNFIHTIEGAERDERAARFRTQGLSYKQIADKLGYADASGAHKAVQRALAAVPTEAAEEVIKQELARLDELHVRANNIMNAVVKSVSQGKILDQQDYNVTMAAMDRVLKIQERRARLLGLDSATKVQSDVNVNYTITGIDPEQLK